MSTTTMLLFFVYFLTTFTTSEGYFGLTGKSQLSELWDIQTSSLAASVNLDTTDEEMPEPSRDYKPVDLRPLPNDHSENTKGSSSTNSEIDGPDYSSHQSKVSPGNRRRPYNLDRTSENSNTGPPHIRIPPSSWSQTSKHSSSPDPSRTHEPRDTYAAIGRRPRTPQAPQTLGNTTMLRRIQKLMRDINQEEDSGNQELVRSERESGKKRDVNKLHLSIVSSSFAHSQIPSRISHYNEEENIHSLNLGNLTAGNATDAIIQYAEPFLGLGEEDFSSYKRFIQARVGNMTPLVEPDDIDRRAARKMCNNFRLTASQLKKCRRDPGMPQVLSEATHIAAAECQYQFRYERWNCSLGTSRIKMLERGTKETAFLYSISSAGLAHAVARACASGYLTRCSCEEHYPGHSKGHAWMWGGCGDNVRYAARFVRKFLRSRNQHKDIRARVDQHNSDVGIRIVKSNVGQSCKCHGVSGSCQTKTCWRKMVPFEVVGKKVKRAYDKAVKVGGVNNANGISNLIRRGRTQSKRLAFSTKLKREQVRRNQRPNNRPNHVPEKHEDSPNRRKGPLGGPKHKEMVYVANSPEYCSKTKHSPGTKGRICFKRKNCDRLCCGRGYTTHVRIIRRSCNCEVQWCCFVQCKVCTERKEIHTCK